MSNYTEATAAVAVGSPPASDAVVQHRAASWRHLAQVDAELERGELEKASQSLWEAAADGVRAAAIRRGWPHDAPGDMGKIIARLIEDEGGSIDLNTNFFIAHSFDRIDREWEIPLHESEVIYCRKPVTEFLKMLEAMD